MHCEQAFLFSLLMARLRTDSAISVWQMSQSQAAEVVISGEAIAPGFFPFYLYFPANHELCCV